MVVSFVRETGPQNGRKIQVKGLYIYNFIINGPERSGVEDEDTKIIVFDIIYNI